jgi:hypothetical protein
VDGSATVSYSDVQGGYSGTGNLNQDPLLAPLGDYGGPTQTMPLLPGSAAIDAGTSSGAPTTDQRGISRVGAVDIGAFESRGFSMTITGGNNQQALVNTAFAVPLSVQVTSSYGEPVQGGVVTFSAPGSGPGAGLSTPLALDAAGQTAVSATANGTAGSYAVSAAANGATPSGSFGLTNLTALAVSPAALPAGTYATAYSQTLTATGGAGGPFTFAVTAGALPGGLTLAAGGALTGTPTAAGAFTFTVQATDSGGFTNSQSYALTIEKAALTVTAGSTSKTYGQALTFAGTEFTASGLVNGDAVTGVTLTSAGAAADAGVSGSPYAVEASAAVGSGLGNYAIRYADGALTVTQKALTVTAGNRTKTYGDSVVFDDTSPSTDFSVSGLVNADAVTSITLTSAGAAATAAVAGSPYAVVASAAVGSGLANYTIRYAPGRLTVRPKALTVTANDATILQGEAAPAFSARYSGFVLGQGPADLGGALTFTTPATAGSPPGAYAVTPGGLTAGNYAITFAPGTLTVLSYGQAAGRLQAQVDAAGLDRGTQSALDTQLQAAIAYFNVGDTADGVSQLGALIHHLRAQSGEKVSAALANAWIAYAQRIIAAVG